MHPNVSKIISDIVINDIIIGSNYIYTLILTKSMMIYITIKNNALI